MGCILKVHTEKGVLIVRVDSRGLIQRVLVKKIDDALIHNRVI